MTAAEFSQIEAELGVVLPAWYREQLAVYPDMEPDDDLFDEADAVVEVNNELRAAGYFGSAWPPEFLVIGQSGAGDPFFIRPGTADRRVFWVDHEGGPEPVVANLDEMEFARTLEEYIAEAKKMRTEGWMGEALPPKGKEAPRKTKPWWQFW